MNPREKKFLITLAKKERKSVSALIRELDLEALDRREDQGLSAISDARLAEPKKIVSHKDVWTALLEEKS